MTRLKMGMIGGGEGAFIGPVHRAAAELDGEIELVCGAFSSDAARSVRSGRKIYQLPERRCYPDYQTMLNIESALPDSERMDFVAIVTPNHIHFPAAKAALESGFHVICDKPLTHRLEDAIELQALVADSGMLFALTHNYTGYPMIREARELVAGGQLGPVRRVIGEYLQGWLATAEESADNKQARWRTDPERAGAAGCFGDIGSHVQNLIEFVTGSGIESVSADLSSFVPGRKLDDDGNVLIRLSDGAKGVVSASQIAVGEENNLKLRIYGELGGLEWSQMEPNSLIVRWRDRPMEVRRTGGIGLSESAMAATRLPAGHPEGYLEAFANIYRSFASAVGVVKSGGLPITDFPDVGDGVSTMRFLDRVVASSLENGRWLELEG